MTCEEVTLVTACTLVTLCKRVSLCHLLDVSYNKSDWHTLADECTAPVRPTDAHFRHMYVFCALGECEGNLPRRARLTVHLSVAGDAQ